MLNFSIKKLIKEENYPELLKIIKNPHDLNKIKEIPGALDDIVEYVIKQDQTSSALYLLFRTEGELLERLIEYMCRTYLSIHEYMERGAYKSLLVDNFDSFFNQAKKYNSKATLLELAYAIDDKTEETREDIDLILKSFLDMNYIDEIKMKEYKKLNTIRLENLIFTSNSANVANYLNWLEDNEIPGFIEKYLFHNKDILKIQGVLNKVAMLPKFKKETIKRGFLNQFMKIEDIDIRNDYLMCYYNSFAQEEIDMYIVKTIINSRSLKHIKALMKKIKVNEQVKICEIYENTDYLTVANLAIATFCIKSKSLVNQILDTKQVELIIYLITNIANNRIKPIFCELASKDPDLFVSVANELIKSNLQYHKEIIAYVFDNHLESHFDNDELELMKQIQAEDKPSETKLI